MGVGLFSQKRWGLGSGAPACHTDTKHDCTVAQRYQDLGTGRATELGVAWCEVVRDLVRRLVRHENWSTDQAKNG
jgi:hypothetical protein